MANQYGFSLGAALKDAELIKGSRTKNRLADIQLQEVEREQEQRPELMRQEQQRKNILSEVRGQAATGDEAATQRLLQLDPEGAPKFIEAVNSMDDRKKEIVTKNLEQMGSMTAAVLQAPEADRPKLYVQMLTQVPESSLAQMPQEYNENFLKMSLAKQRAMDDILSVKSVTHGKKSILTKGGLEAGRADIPAKKGSGSGAGGLKPSDESRIYNDMVKTMAGIDLGSEDGIKSFSELNQQARDNILSVASRAVQIYRENPGISVTAAKTQARKEAGATPSVYKTPSPSNPTGNERQSFFDKYN